jgi:hypothetical protein
MAIILADLTGVQFERLIAQLLTKIGLEVTSTKESGDGGIDLIAISDQPFFEGKYIIQCKRWSGSVGEPVVRDLYGVVMSERANKGILVTTSSFTRQALKFAANKPMELIDGEKLVSLLDKQRLLVSGNPPPSGGGLEEEIYYLQREVARDPKNVGLHSKLLRLQARAVRGLAARIFSVYERETDTDLIQLIEECERSLTEIIEINSSHNPGVNAKFVKCLSLAQIGVLNILQGKIADGIRCMRQATEVYMAGGPNADYVRELCRASNDFGSQPRTHMMNPGDALYVMNVLNIIHLTTFSGAGDLINRLGSQELKSVDLFIHRVVERIECLAEPAGLHHAPFFLDIYFPGADDLVKYESLGVNNNIQQLCSTTKGLLMNTDLLTFPTFVISKDDRWLSGFEWVYLRIKDDITNGKFKGIFSLSEDEKAHQRSIIRSLV